MKKKLRKFWEKKYSKLFAIANGQFEDVDEEKLRKIRRRVEYRLRTDRSATKTVALLLGVNLDD